MADRRFQAQITEVTNRNLLVSELIRLGYNVYLPVYDRGVDLIAYGNNGKSLLPVQLKGRWTINEKYRQQAIWIAFSEGGSWYLAPHDEMVSIGERMGYCSSSSWTIAGAYSCPSFSRKLEAEMIPWRLGPSHSAAIES